MLLRPMVEQQIAGTGVEADHGKMPPAPGSPVRLLMPPMFTTARGRAPEGGNVKYEANGAP